MDEVEHLLSKGSSIAETRFCIVQSFAWEIFLRIVPVALQGMPAIPHWPAPTLPIYLILLLLIQTHRMHRLKICLMNDSNIFGNAPHLYS